MPETTKGLYVVAVVVPERKADKDEGIEARAEIVVVPPSLKYLTPDEAKPHELIASKKACAALDGIARKDICVSIQAVPSAFPFC